MSKTIAELLPSEAHALRPVRMVRDEAAHYTGTTFPERPRSGCERLLRMANITGGLGYPGDPLADLWVDVLDESGDILQEWPVDRRCFEYLRRKLRFVRETQTNQDPHG